MNEFMGANKFDKALDDILPAWRTKLGGSYRHTWTSPRGLFTVEITPDGPGTVAEFSGQAWEAKVPATVAGLDALVVVMVLAGAIEPPDAPYKIGVVPGGVRETGPSGADARFYGPFAAFALGVALIERAGHVAGWRA